ncbi:hypothetical protein MMC32_007812 [Xylographa parallela]|nr:hypothetical protein [Xylographa parallela]
MERAGTPIVMYGTGGIGKTQLVREFLYTHAPDFTSRLVSLYARKPTIWPPPYTKIARYLNLIGHVDRLGQITLNEKGLGPIVKATTEWLNREGNTEWLLVFDNVDDLETCRITDYFPNMKYGSIIVTSRRPEASRLGEGWSLPIMSERESISLLRKTYGREIDVSDTDYEDAKQTVHILKNLPLAIDQAGAYLNKRAKPLASSAPLFEANYARLIFRDAQTGLL